MTKNREILYLVDMTFGCGVDQLVELRHEDAVSGDAHLLGTATERRQTLTRLGRPAHDDLRTGIKTSDDCELTCTCTCVIDYSSLYNRQLGYHH